MTKKTSAVTKINDRRPWVDASSSAELEKPTDLGRYASEKWDELVADLGDRARPDLRHQIKLAAVTYEEWWHAYDMMFEDGMLIQDERGSWKKNPVAMIVSSAGQRHQVALKELGLSRA